MSILAEKVHYYFKPDTDFFEFLFSSWDDEQKGSQIEVKLLTPKTSTYIIFYVYGILSQS